MLHNYVTLQNMVLEDIPKWIALSKEYDEYVSELVDNLTQWYDGNGIDLCFFAYMKSKIGKSEAFIALEINENICLGVIAISKKLNRITFFGISHISDYEHVGEMLIRKAFMQLDASKNITISVIRSNAKHIEKERCLIRSLGFEFLRNDSENGVPVDTFLRKK